jgi:hypothetical protein
VSLDRLQSLAKDPAAWRGSGRVWVLRLVWAFAVAVILILVGSGCAGGGKLGAGRLSEEASSLRSAAAEGALLARAAAAGKSTDIYRREHALDLYDAASQAKTSLQAAETMPSLKRKLRRLTALAGQVSADLERLAGATEREAGRLGRQLRAAAEQAKKIDQGLA